MEFLPVIKQSTNAVINVLTGGGLGPTRGEAVAGGGGPARKWPRSTSGSMNFGIFPMAAKYTNWKHDWEPQFLEMTRDFIFRNTFGDTRICREGVWVKVNGTKVRVQECYDLGHLYNLTRWLIDQGFGSSHHSSCR